MIIVIYSRCREATGTQDQLVTPRLAAPIGEPGDHYRLDRSGRFSFPGGRRGRVSHQKAALARTSMSQRRLSENIEYLSDQYAPAEYRRQLVRNRPRIVRAERLALKLAHRRLSSSSARGIAHYHLIDGRNGRDARVSVRISFDNFSSSTRRASTIAPTMADQAAIAARLFLVGVSPSASVLRCLIRRRTPSVMLCRSSADPRAASVPRLENRQEVALLSRCLTLR
jgi:hypothetical protein